MRFLLIAALVTLGATPLAAQAFKAENGVTVVPVTGGFSVTGDAGLGARGMWCAAADYARTVLATRDAQRLYIAEGRPSGLGQRSAVKFTVDPTGLTPSTVVLLGSSLRTAGANLSIGHAYGFCADGKLLRGGRGR